MWTMAVPWWEFLVRGAIVYLFLIVLLRLSGSASRPAGAFRSGVVSGPEQRRSELNERWRQFCNRRFDLGLNLVALNWVIGYATFRNKRFEQFMKGKPQIMHISRWSCLSGRGRPRETDPAWLRGSPSGRRLCGDHGCTFCNYRKQRPNRRPS